MTPIEARLLLDEFVSNTKDQESIAYWLNRLAMLCSAGAKARGFHEDEEHLRNCCEHGLFEEGSSYEEGPVSDSWLQKNLAWLDSAILQAEIARQVSELGEAVEAIRKPGPDQHLPQHQGFLVEEADCVIRIGDTCGKREMDLGQAVVDKLLYNMTRPFKHGKQS